MTRFGKDIDRFNKKLAKKPVEFIDRATDEVFNSIVNGSALTGAPGQPVLSGALKRSWVKRRTSAGTSEVVTDSPYARTIEDLFGRFGKIQIRSAVGGGHSVKMTQAAWDQIIFKVLQDIESSQ